MNTEVNDQKQSAPTGDESPAARSEVQSEALAATVTDLLAASEQAAQALEGRAKVDLDALRRSGGRPDELPQLEASVSQLTKLVKELQADVDKLKAEPRLGGEGRPSPPSPDPANGQPQFDRRAMLISLNMAINGASRSEAADYLAENLNLRDCDRLLGAVYEFVASTRTGR